MVNSCGSKPTEGPIPDTYCEGLSSLRVPQFTLGHLPHPLQGVNIFKDDFLGEVRLKSMEGGRDRLCYPAVISKGAA